MHRSTIFLAALASFVGACSDPTAPPPDRPAVGTLTVVVVTTGPGPAPEHTLLINGRKFGAIAANDTARVSVRRADRVTVGLTPGPYCLEDNGPSYGRAGDVVHLEATCPGTGTVRFLTRTAGTPRDHRYSIFLYGERIESARDLDGWRFGWDWDMTPYLTREVGSDDTVTAELTVGAYWAHFMPAPNCSTAPAQQAPIEVGVGEASEMAFDVTCEPEGRLSMTVFATGGDVPANVGLRLQGSAYPFQTEVRAPTNASWEGPLSAGAWTGALVAAQNCSVAGPNPVTFTVDTAATTSLRFDVTCAITQGTLRVTMAASGPNVPAWFTIGVDHSCDWNWDCAGVHTVPANGHLTLKLNPGQHSVAVLESPSNCSVPSAGPIVSDVLAGETSEVAFAATCR